MEEPVKILKKATTWPVFTDVKDILEQLPVSSKIKDVYNL